MVKKTYILIFVFLMIFPFQKSEKLLANVFSNTKYSVLEQKLEFSVRWFAYNFAIHDPIETGQIFPPNMRLRPVGIEQTSKLNYRWKGGLKTEDAIYKQFITVAEAASNFANGNYEFSVTWKEAVRIYVDGKLVLDEWKPSITKLNKAHNKKIELQLGGTHLILVEHVALKEVAALSLVLKKIS